MTRLIYAASALAGICAGIALVWRAAVRAQSHIVRVPDLLEST